MKFFISADIEGTTGCLNWDYTMGKSREYEIQKEIMTQEVLSCVKALTKVHPDCEILIKDAHHYGNNLDIRIFPKNCKIIRGWSHKPHSMVQELNETFDAILFIGYHNAATMSSTPLSHSFNGSKFQRMRLNEEICSEFLFNYSIALHYGVPTILLTGDMGICEEVRKKDSSIHTVYTYEGVGESIITKTPESVYDEIYQATIQAAKNIKKISPTKKPYTLQIQYKKHTDCLKASNYPGSRMLDSVTLSLSANNILELEKAFLFL
ncbi:M55 family metallopeptidase [Lagierella sp.]|uniref:M55 family metallopeptidase n=1 Tax=Lagierella sp. TaxID=2849657 RepID=UPI00260BFE72|nr:M55 family metallopeptidase [Lagierella sp.]